MSIAYMLSLGIGILTALLGLPLLMGKVKQNRLYGFRTKKVLEDKNLWVKANKFSGGLMLIAGIIIVALTLMLYMTDSALYETSLWLVILGPVVVMTIIGLLYSKSI